MEQLANNRHRLYPPLHDQGCWILGKRRATEALPRSPTPTIVLELGSSTITTEHHRRRRDLFLQNPALTDIRLLRLCTSSSTTEHRRPSQRDIGDIARHKRDFKRDRETQTDQSSPHPRPSSDHTLPLTPKHLTAVASITPVCTSPDFQSRTHFWTVSPSRLQLPYFFSRPVERPSNWHRHATCCANTPGFPACIKASPSFYTPPDSIAFNPCESRFSRSRPSSARNHQP